MFGSSKSGKVVSAGPVDSQFNYVTALLHGDGTNGAQNNTFLDSSSNNATITRTGTPTQGSFSPYGSLWSNYFGGSSSYLTVPYSASLAFGTGDYTVEFWIFWTGGANENNPIMNNASGGFNIKLANGSGQWSLENSYVGSVANLGTAPTQNVWHHLAISRASGTVKAFIDGTQVFSGSDSTNWTNSNTWYIGANGYSPSTYYITGNISNLRIVKGTALYTSSFTPSTTPLTAVTNTQLLTCQSNRFIDNSANNFAITPTGTPSVQRFNPFLPTYSQAYSTSVYGGSGYFSTATPDSISIPNNSGMNFGTGDFTVEAWIYLTSGTGSNYGQQIIGKGNGSTGWAFEINRTGSGYGLLATTADGTAIGIYNTTYLLANVWYHVAWTRSTLTAKLFLNGVQVASATDVTNDTNTNTLWVASQANNGSGQNFPGYITDARIVKGTALYTTAFTPNTAPLTAISGTSYLGSMTNGAIYDNAMMNDLVTVGSAQISTSVKKYGTGSLSFNGTTDYLISPNGSSLTFGTGAFTVECWIYLNNVTANATKGVVVGANPTQNAFGLRIGQSYLGNVNGLGLAKTGVGDLDYCSFTFSTGTWYHIAVVRNGTTIYFFVNGTQQTTLGSGGGSFSFITPTTFYIGCNNDKDEKFAGYIDDLRITQGYARYTANFTPPTTALPNYGS